MRSSGDNSSNSIIESSSSFDRRPLERAVKANVKSLIKVLSKIHETETAYTSFTEAQTANTAEAYGKFLRAHGGSIFARDAQLSIERLVFEEAQNVNTIAAYRQFLAKYGISTFANDAHASITALKFDEAKVIDTPAAYRTFLIENPNSKHEAEAYRLLTDVQNRRVVELTAIFDSLSNVDIGSESFASYELSDFVRAVPAQKGDAQARAFECLNQMVTRDSTIILDVIGLFTSEEEALSEGARLTLQYVQNDKAVDALFVTSAQFEGPELREAMAFLERNQAPQQMERYVSTHSLDQMTDLVANFLALTTVPDRRIAKQSLHLLEQLVSADSSAILTCLAYLTVEDQQLAQGARRCFLRLHNPNGVKPLVDYLYSGYDDWELAYILAYLRRHEAPEYDEILQKDENTILASLRATLAETTNPGFVALTIDAGPPGLAATREEFSRLKKKYDDAAADEANQKALGFLFTALAAIGSEALSNESIDFSISDVTFRIQVQPLVDDNWTLDDWTALGDHFSRQSVEEKEYFRYRFTTLLEGMKRIRNPGLIPAIKNELRNPKNDEGTFKRALCIGWGNVGDDAFPSILNGLKDEQLQTYAEEALYNLGGRHAVSLIGSRLHSKDENIRYYCVSALSQIGSPEAIAALQPLKSDRSVKVSDAARAASKLGKENPGIKNLAKKIEGANKILKVDVLKVYREGNRSEPTNVYLDGRVLYRAHFELSIEIVTATPEEFVDIAQRKGYAAFEYSQGSLVYIDEVKLDKKDIKIEIRGDAGEKTALRLKFNKPNYTLAEVQQAFSYAFGEDETLKR